jgi:hypothetical protein
MVCAFYLNLKTIVEHWEKKSGKGYRQVGVLGFLKPLRGDDQLATLQLCQHCSGGLAERQGPCRRLEPLPPGLSGLPGTQLSLQPLQQSQCGELGELTESAALNPMADCQKCLLAM